MDASKWCFAACYAAWAVRGFFIRLDPPVVFAAHVLIVALGVWAFRDVLAKDTKRMAAHVRQPRSVPTTIALFVTALIAGSVIVNLLQAVAGLSEYQLENDVAVGGVVDKQPELLAALLICLLGPLGEELFFRGFLLRLFGPWCGSAAAIVLAGLCFGLVHMSAPTAAELIFVVPHICAGIGFGIVAWRGGIVLSFVLHAGINTMAVLPMLVS